MIYIATATITVLWSILSQHITSLKPLTPATLMSLCSILLQQLLRPYDLYCHSNYNSYVPRTSTVTATITALYSILFQQLLRPYDLYCYSTYYVTKTFILQQLLRPYDLYCYSNYYIPMICIVTTYITSIRSLSLQPITSLWSLYPANVRHAPIAATGVPPPNAPYQERPGGRQAKHPRLCFLCYHIVFYCFAICVIRYLPNWRP